jgi:hypothetical protein
LGTKVGAQITKIAEEVGGRSVALAVGVARRLFALIKGGDGRDLVGQELKVEDVDVLRDTDRIRRPRGGGVT